VNRRVVFGVVAAWVLAGFVLGGQSALDVAMRGGKGTPLSVAFIQTLVWIPVTLAAIAMAIRVPFSRERWSKPAMVHFVAAIVLSFVANTLTVLGYMAMTPAGAIAVDVVPGSDDVFLATEPVNTDRTDEVPASVASDDANAPG